MIEQSIKHNIEKQEQIEKFFQFTRWMNEHEQTEHSMQLRNRKRVEIKFWSLLVKNVIRLDTSDHKYLQMNTSLQDKMIEYINEKKGICTRHNKIIGKKKLLKK